jgi:hypothetical protein
MKPVWIDPSLELLYERVFARFKQSPHLWHPDILPVPRIFLLFGQKGSGMMEAVNALNLKYKISAALVKLNPVEEVSAESLMNLQNHKVDLLVIDKAHYFLNHPKLAPLSMNLKSFTSSFPFILVVSEVWPTPNNHFWSQFSRDRIILMSTPSKDHHKALLEYYMLLWQNHWRYSKVVLSTEDYENLAIASSYCTPKDVKAFMRTIFTQVQRVYPSECIDVTPELLERNYRNPSNVPGVWSICAECPDKRQRAYEVGSGLGGATGGSNAVPAVPKKRKVDDLIIE